MTKNVGFVSAYLKDGETCPLCGRERTPITVYGPPKMILNKNESGPNKFRYRIKCNACGRQFHVIYSAVDVEEINPPYVR